MALLDVAAQNGILDNNFGGSKGPAAPNSFTLELWAGDPADGGVQLDNAGGYSPLTVTNNGTNFPPADAGAKTMATQTFATSTGEWLAGGNPDVATHWLLRDPVTGAAWFSARLADEVSVETSGTTVTVTPVIYVATQQQLVA